MGQTPSIGKLTDKDKDILSKCYMSLKGKNEEISAMLYANMCVMAPDLGRHFSINLGSKQFDAHSGKFIKEMLMIIQSLNKDENLTSLLVKNANSHMDMEITPDDFELLKVVFLKTLKHTLKQEFTSDVEQACGNGLTVAFSYIWSKMLEFRTKRLSMYRRLSQ